jgi:hypothetical protein
MATSKFSSLQLHLTWCIKRLDIIEYFLICNTTQYAYCFSISQKCNIIPLLMMSVVLIIQTHIRNMYNLSFSWDTGYNNWGFYGFAEMLPHLYQDNFHPNPLQSIINLSLSFDIMICLLLRALWNNPQKKHFRNCMEYFHPPVSLL